MFHVDSEAGRLRQAILHRPGLELKRLSPTNHDDYLFDDVLWVKRAKEEHDAFAEALREAGVRVHLLHELLRGTVAIPEAASTSSRAPSTSGCTDPLPPTPSTRRSPTSTTSSWSSTSSGASPSARCSITSRRPAVWSCSRWIPTTCCCRRCPTTSSPATPPPGSTTASRSTRCVRRPAPARRCTTRPSTAGTRSLPVVTSTCGRRGRSTDRPPPRAATST